MKRETKTEKFNRGTDRVDRERVSSSFAPLTDLPAIPEHLSPEGQWFFSWVCEMLLSNGSLTTGNIPDITVASTWWGVYKEAERQVEQNGIVQTFANGTTNISPYVSTLDKATNQIQKFSDRYGLSLLSRQRVGVIEKKKENPFDDI